MRVSGAPLVALTTDPSRVQNHRAVSDLNPLAFFIRSRLGLPHVASNAAFMLSVAISLKSRADCQRPSASDQKRESKALKASVSWALASALRERGPAKALVAVKPPRLITVDKTGKRIVVIRGEKS